MRDAAAAMQRGDFPAAERALRAELQKRPDDGLVLSLLGLTLDNLKQPRKRMKLSAAPWRMLRALPMCKATTAPSPLHRRREGPARRS